mgnify:FL=1
MPGQQGCVVRNLLEKYISSYDSSTVTGICGAELITSADRCKPFAVESISCYLITDGAWCPVQNFTETAVPGRVKLSALVNDAF